MPYPVDQRFGMAICFEGLQKKLKGKTPNFMADSDVVQTLEVLGCKKIFFCMPPSNKKPEVLARSICLDKSIS